MRSDRAAFGIDFGVSKTPIQSSNPMVTSSICNGPFRQMLRQMPGTMYRKVGRTNRKLIYWLDKIVSKRIQEKERVPRTFLSLILNVRESKTVSEKRFSSDYISALIYEHLLGGSATTAFTLPSIFHPMAGHPKAEK
ncbi:hypothetical protein Ancab_023041 [Ancistrocladus abbreviatus]